MTKLERDRKALKESRPLSRLDELFAIGWRLIRVSTMSCDGTVTITLILDEVAKDYERTKL